MLLDATLLLGMHPDQATEPIVDLGLALRVPFAVVPCCVFPDAAMFSHRKEVRTYEAFLTYLCAKDPGMVRVTLPFDGKNIMLFWPGPRS